MELNQTSEEELCYWLAFDALRGGGFGPKKVIRLFDRFQSIKRAWQASKTDLISIADMQMDAAENLIQKRNAIDPEKLLKNVLVNDVQCLAYNDPMYPLRLRQIHDPPLVLYVKGELLEHDFNGVIGLVGTRRPTAYGQKIAKDFARGLSANGVLVVSGLAIGIDSLAHWGALEGGGRTVAVVGTGPDLCYPSSNKRLYDAILDGHGAIVSEHPPGARAEKWHFPARNRIISGLSNAVLVVEAGKTSGSLITAKLAFEQNREVFAVPGRVDSPMSEGTNDLISRNIAHLISNYEEILDQLKWVKTTRPNHVTTVVELYGREKEIYEMLSNEPIHFDVLCEKAGMAAGEMSATLTMLELAGLVIRHPGDWYTLQDAIDFSVQRPDLSNLRID